MQDNGCYNYSFYMDVVIMSLLILNPALYRTI